jgi:hypothetical protein
MMPAGKYWIGDLCYVLGNVWDEFCDLTTSGHICLNGEFELSDGRKFATYGTAYGDGVYIDESGRTYGVDAGLIGCTLAEGLTEGIELGHIVDFPSDFVTYYEDKGVIRFGNVYIDTNPSEHYWDDGPTSYDEDE